MATDPNLLVEDPQPELPLNMVENVAPLAPEGTEVAMLGAVTKAGRGVKRIDRSKLDPNAAVQTYRGATLIREASPSEMAVFEAALPRLDGKPGNTGIQYYELNLDQMREVFGDDLTAFQSKIVELNRNAIEEAKRGKMSIKEIGLEAETMGLEMMMTRLLKRQTGTALKSPEELYKALIVQRSTLQMARHAYDRLMREGTEEAASDFLGAMTLQGAVTTSLIGAKTETARMMAVLRNFNMVVDAQTSPDLDDLMGVMGEVPDMGLTPGQIVENAGGVEAIQHMGTQYMSLTNGQKANLNRSAWRFVGKTYDAFVESFLMSILSGVTTHGVNIASNAASMIAEIPINTIAATIGKVRGTEDAISYQEAFVDVIASYHAIGDSMRAFGQAFKTEQPGNFVTKLDYKRQAISAENFEIDPNSGRGQVFDAMGRLIRLPGTFLLATDEAFKVIAMRQHIYRESISQGMAIRRAGKQTGETDEAFKSRIDEKIAQIIENPPSTVREAADEYALYKTFQTPVAGKALTTLQELTNVPPFKFLMPFFQTPTNVIAQVFEHTPAAFATRRFREQISKGGKHADVATARMMAGTGMMGYFVMSSMGMFGDQRMMTGYGPTEPKARQNWLDQGFRPYSFVTKNEDGTYKSVSYSRFDPISGLLAIAADTGWHMRHNPGDPTAVVMAALGASYHYLNELPMMQGFGEITKLFQGSADEDPMALMERVSKMYGRAMAKTVPGFLPVSPTGSFADSVQRYMDPEKRDTTFPEDARQFFSNYAGTGPLDGVVQNFYESLQTARSMMPGISQDLPPLRDRFNNTKMESSSQAYEMVSPIRVQDSMLSPVHDELRSLQYGLPDRHRQIGGVELSAEQKNRYIDLANTLEDPKSGLNLLGQLNSVMQKYKEQDPDGTLIMRGERINRLLAADQKYWNLAAKHMRRENPELDAAIKDASANLKTFGPPVKSPVPNFE